MSYNNLFEEALHLFDEAHYDEAEAHLRQILETAPDQPDVMNMLGLIAQAKGLHEQACPYFLAAIRQKPQEASFYYNLAFSQKLSGYLHEAAKNYNKVLSLAPQIKETHNELGCVYEALSELSLAQEHWLSALKMDENYAEAAINLAYSYRHTSTEDAKQKLLALTPKFSDNPLLMYDLAHLNYKMKIFEEAIDFIENCILVSPDNAEALLLKGLLLKETKKTDKAKDCFLKAEIFSPNNIEILLSLADMFSLEQNFDEAEKRYKRLLELAPKNFAVHNNYAEMLFKQKRTVEALEEYRQAVILNPKSPEVSNNLGVVLKDLHDYDQALGLFFNALGLAPEMDEISVNIAETLILMAADDIKKSREIAQNWKKSYPNNQFAHHLCAALLGENIENNQIFTEKLFDNFADNYELVMQNLDYSAPLAVGRIAGPMEGRIVDLGCGSGLVGMVVKTPKNSIIGVDLSSKMLDIAAKKNVYDELIKSDIIDFLKERRDYDWIITTDVLGYIGNPEEFIRLCQAKNLIFSIETLNTNENYTLQTTGRFQHNPVYIEKLLQQNGFCDIYKENLVLRTENGKAVDGYIFKGVKG